MKKIVFIIGASSGIGLSTARKLCNDDTVVICGARTECPDKRVKSIILDVAVPSTVDKAVKEILEEYGKIDWFVYSAGFSLAAPIEYTESLDYEYLFDVNFFGVLTSLQAILPKMREVGYGKIILVGSTGGFIPIAYDAFYSASKTALIMLARNLNLETKKYGLRTTTVMPGGTATRFTFKRKVYPSDEVGGYADEVHVAVASLAQTEQNGMSPERVAGIVISTLNKKNPPNFLSCGFLNKLFYLAEKFLPDRLIQYMVAKKFKLI